MKDLNRLYACADIIAAVERSVCDTNLCPAAVLVSPARMVAFGGGARDAVSVTTSWGDVQVFTSGTVAGRDIVLLWATAADASAGYRPTQHARRPASIESPALHASP